MCKPCDDRIEEALRSFLDQIIDLAFSKRVLPVCVPRRPSHPPLPIRQVAVTCPQKLVTQVESSG